MKKMIFGVMAILGLIAIVYVVSAVKLVKYEEKEGFLDFFGEYCLLSLHKEHLEPVSCDGKSSDLCEMIYFQKFGTTFGLEKEFCELHKDLLGTLIRIRGVRVSGEAIHQDCSNRSCFNDVELVSLVENSEVVNKVSDDSK